MRCHSNVKMKFKENLSQNCRQNPHISGALNYVLFTIFCLVWVWLSSQLETKTLSAVC